MSYYGNNGRLGVTGGARRPTTKWSPSGRPWWSRRGSEPDRERYHGGPRSRTTAESNAQQGVPRSLSILHYPGGKTRAVQQLASFIPADCTFIVSPFVGGASFELHCAQTLGLPVFASDVDESLMSFWWHLKHQRGALLGAISHLYADLRQASDKAARHALFHDWCQTLRNASSGHGRAHHLPIQAAVFYAVNRLSFNGRMEAGGLSECAARRGFTDRSMAALAGVNLDGLQFSGGDFRDVLADFMINRSADQGGVLFCDPPYYLERHNAKLYGPGGRLHREFPHGELQALLSGCQRWILCYNNCEAVRELYRGCPQYELSWSYGGPSGSGRSVNNELVITSPDLHGLVPIRADA